MIATLAAIPLSVVAACAVDPGEEVETESTEQALGPSCVILRPYLWDNGIFVCSEGPIVPPGTTLTLGPGQSFEFRTVIQVAGLGRGSVTVRCRTDGSGQWDELDRTCFKKVGPPPIEP